MGFCQNSGDEYVYIRLSNKSFYYIFVLDFLHIKPLAYNAFAREASSQDVAGVIVEFVIISSQKHASLSLFYIL